MKKKKISASLEDYLEAIFNLADEFNVARSKDIAERLTVSKASVTGALRLLKKKALVNYEPYGYITLTEDGAKTAAEVAKKHKIIESFFVDILDIDAGTARDAACRAEHTLGNDVVSKLMCFVEYVNQHSGSIAEDFRSYCNSSRKVK